MLPSDEPMVKALDRPVLKRRALTHTVAKP
jgi:hypothetical protein